MITKNPAMEAAKRQICTNQCPHKCQDFLEGKIDFTDMGHSCPVNWSGGWVGLSDEPPVAPPTWYQRRMAVAATWKELHTYAPSGDINKDRRWLRDFSVRVQGPKCACQANWMEWVRLHRPRWQDWFAWTVEAHNAVNARLGKPVLSLQQAKDIWLPRIVPTV